MGPGCATEPGTEAVPARRLTSGAFSVAADGSGAGADGFAWSPDGAHIAITYLRDPDLISTGTAGIAVVEVSTGALKKIVTGGGTEHDSGLVTRRAGDRVPDSGRVQIFLLYGHAPCRCQH